MSLNRSVIEPPSGMLGMLLQSLCMALCCFFTSFFPCKLLPLPTPVSFMLGIYCLAPACRGCCAAAVKAAPVLGSPQLPLPDPLSN